MASYGGWAAIVGLMQLNSLLIPKRPETNPQTVRCQLQKYLSGLHLIYLHWDFYLLASSVFLTNSLFRRLYLIDEWQHHRTLLSFVLCILIGVITVVISWRVGVNEFSLHYFYRNRLVRAYLGATRPRKQREQTVNKFTNFDKLDDMKLASLVKENSYCGPFMILNTALNATVITDELDRQDRKAESFVFTSKYCGFDCSRTRSAARSTKKSYEFAYRPTKDYSAEGGPDLGTAMTVSGAAVNPNMGYHSSPATAFLLTIFNVRLGCWIGNPRKSYWKYADPKFGLAYLISDLVGTSDTTANFVSLSDGGHFDNMGIYELIRRRCKYILLCDAEEDDDLSCEGLANAIRRCRIDFGAQIDIDISDITTLDKDTKFAKQHFVTGTIWYPGDHPQRPSGVLTYVKASLTSNLSVDIREYFIQNKQFPQQSTGDQFFDEAQFESYRKLGFSSLDKNGDEPVQKDGEQKSK